MTAGVGAAELIDLTDMRPFVAGTQYELYRTLREHDPLHWNDEADGGRGFWSLMRYADVKAGISDHQWLSSAEGTQIADRRVEGKLHSFHDMDEPRHGKLRRIGSSYLRAVKVKEWQESVRASVTALLDEAQERGDVEFVHAVSANLPIRVIALILGVPPADCPQLAEWSNQAHIQDPEYVTAEATREHAREQLFAYVRELSDERRARPKDDLVSVLVQGTVDGESLSWEELAAYYIILMAAGNETTRHLISGAVDAFDRFPGEWARPRADHALLTPGIEEPDHAFGAWHGGPVVSRETWKLAELDPADRSTLHRQTVSKVRREDGTEGVGIFEHCVVGAHRPTGVPEGTTPPLA